jgi:hypothetical protein
VLNALLVYLNLHWQLYALFIDEEIIHMVWQYGSRIYALNYRMYSTLLYCTIFHTSKSSLVLFCNNSELKVGIFWMLKNFLSSYIIVKLEKIIFENICQVKTWFKILVFCIWVKKLKYLFTRIEFLNYPLCHTVP